MKVAALIAEYNPFHFGHLYQINEIKNKYNIDKLIVIMSGDFTERGEPAVIGKELRAKHALIAGADLVLLLPIAYSTASADLFAYGAISILNRLNVIDYLFFGSECGDIELLKECADKSISSDSNISQLMKKGYTYAKARELALSDYSNIISCPNNILGIEYIIAIKKLNSGIIPVTIKRTSDNYNDSTINNNDIFASAMAIRSNIFSKKFENIISQVPDYVYADLINEHPVNIDSFSDELYYALLSNKECLSEYMDVSDDLMNRIISNMDEYDSPSELILGLKSKNFTYTRLSRALLHILLNLKHDNKYYKNLCDSLNYVRILGFRKSSYDLLSEIGKKSDILLTSKIPDIYENMSDAEKELCDLELFASEIYSRKSQNKRHEYTRPIIII